LGFELGTYASSCIRILIGSHSLPSGRLLWSFRMIDNKVVKILPRIWVQFNGLPNELCDFFIIWVVGSILGMTKDVDMVFTRKHDICHLQALVLDPNLIPQFVDVVIGGCLYTLQFCVEERVDDNEPEPMDMNNDFQDDEEQQEDHGK
jgi:hypothetical protein